MTTASSFLRLAFLEDVERQSSCARKTRRAKLALALLHLKRLRSTIKERSFLAASCLKLPFQTPWYHLLSTADVLSFLSTTAVTRGVFNYVLGYFQDDFVVRSGPGKVYRLAPVPHKHAVHAIVMMYYAGTMEFKVLQNLSGALSKSLALIPEAQFRWPSFETHSEWSRLVQRKEQQLENRFCFIDGKNFRVQEPSPADLQNAFYNGKHGVGFTQCWSPERLHLVWMARSFGESITVPVHGMIPKPAEVSKRSFCMNNLHCRRWGR
ncbi:hypothetical protein PsorP6_014856 [Peronosclerospora sorghi]|uniref:Uncharacterized protein n=1 Tax=Peronosclerospora sorghi TaxID=230839 RepID=A0ACC0VRG0_9STRA|nr:hypothetical protein PsorP6_014856 [Peronosclerospora sorghi]